MIHAFSKLPWYRIPEPGISQPSLESFVLLAILGVLIVVAWVSGRQLWRAMR